MHSVVTVECHSAALDRAVTYTALVPQAGTPPFAVLYQLHGASDDHRAWLEKSNLLRLRRRAAARGGDAVGREQLHVGAVGEAGRRRHPGGTSSARFACGPGRAAIGGLSMGGYGAIRLGLLYPHRYASIFAHSSRLAESADDHDVGVVAERLERATMPALAFDCGVDDHLIDDSRRFHARLDALGVPHQYREHPGAHTWEYWDEHVREALAWHVRVLGL